jgi:hypothetical protein
MSQVGSGFPIEGVLERQLKSWRLAKLLFTRAKELFAEPPEIHMLDVLASKPANASLTGFEVVS